jgi:hypothetical protein
MGVFMVKRSKCDGNACVEWKMARCIDVGEDVYPQTYDRLTHVYHETYQNYPPVSAPSMYAANHAFAQKAIPLMETQSRDHCMTLLSENLKVTLEGFMRSA